MPAGSLVQFIEHQKHFDELFRQRQDPNSHRWYQDLQDTRSWLRKFTQQAEFDSIINSIPVTLTFKEQYSLTFEELLKAQDRQTRNIEEV